MWSLCAWRSEGLAALRKPCMGRRALIHSLARGARVEAAALGDDVDRAGDDEYDDNHQCDDDHHNHHRQTTTNNFDVEQQATFNK